MKTDAAGQQLVLPRQAALRGVVAAGEARAAARPRRRRRWRSCAAAAPAAGSASLCSFMSFPPETAAPRAPCSARRRARSTPTGWPSSTVQRPAIITRSARWAPQSTSAASGSPAPEKRSSSRVNSARSACLPTAIVPMSSRPRQAAEPAVAQRSTSRWRQRRVVGEPAEQQRVAHALHQVRAVVRGRAVDAEAELDAGRLELAGAALAGGERHVRGRAMADARRPPRRAGAISASSKWMPCASQVRVPHPADRLEVVERPQPEGREAEGVLVMGLGEMGVQPAAAARGELRRAGHQFAASPRTASRAPAPPGSSRPRTRRDAGRSPARSRRGSRRRPAPRCRAAGRRPSRDRFIEPRFSVMRMPSARASLGLDVERVLEPAPGRRTGGRTSR